MAFEVLHRALTVLTLRACITEGFRSVLPVFMHGQVFGQGQSAFLTRNWNFLLNTQTNNFKYIFHVIFESAITFYFYSISNFTVSVLSSGFTYAIPKNARMASSVSRGLAGNAFPANAPSSVRDSLYSFRE